MIPAMLLRAGSTKRAQSRAVGAGMQEGMAPRSSRNIENMEKLRIAMRFAECAEDPKSSFWRERQKQDITRCQH